MKVLTQITMASVATLAPIGCGDDYNDTNTPTDTTDTSSSVDTPNGTNTPDVATAALKVSNRNAKFLVDTDAMSLYTFDKDMLNTSNCDAACQEIWPLFLGGNTESEDIKVLEGTDHLAYRKHPLYYFVNDKAPGDILGNNIKDVWHLVHAPAASNDSQTKFSDATLKQTYLTDKDGRSLYTFDKDTQNVSNCYDTTTTSGEGCESVWPVFYSADLGTLPTGTTALFGSMVQKG